MHEYWNHVKDQLLTYSVVIIVYSIAYALSVYHELRDAEAVYVSDFIPLSIIFIFGGATWSYYKSRKDTNTKE